MVYLDFLADGSGHNILENRWYYLILEGRIREFRPTVQEYYWVIFLLIIILIYSNILYVIQPGILPIFILFTPYDAISFLADLLIG